MTCHYCSNNATHTLELPTMFLYAGTPLCDECYDAAAESDAVHNAELRMYGNR